MAKTSYLIGLGSNRYAGQAPAAVIDRAIAALGEAGLRICRQSGIIITRPLGPGRRNYANAALVCETDLAPRQLLDLCQAIEADFGRRNTRRWGDRIIDLDLLLWSAGCWSDAQLTLPHPAFRTRSFVLDLLIKIAADWRDPLSGLTIRQLHFRQRHNRPVDRAQSRP